MARATVTTNQGKFYRYLIFCPACESCHGMDKGWGFDGNYDFPTFTPSIKVTWVTGLVSDGTKKNHVCHSFVTRGKIRFLTDCTHKLSGQEVDLPDEFTNDFNTEDYTDAVERLDFKN